MINNRRGLLVGIMFLSLLATNQLYADEKPAQAALEQIASDEIAARIEQKLAMQMREIETELQLELPESQHNTGISAEVEFSREAPQPNSYPVVKRPGSNTLQF